MSRRSFLKGSLALIGSSFLPRFAISSAADNQTIYDCIILGAGAAGLTAARQLSQSKIKGQRPKILVLEANNRIGGRIFTDHSKAIDFGSPLELGAEYIHVAPGIAPIWNEVYRYDLETKAYPKLLKGYLYNSEFLAPTPHSPLYSIGHLNFRILRSYRIFKDIQNYEGPDISGARFIKKMGSTGWYHGFAVVAAKIEVEFLEMVPVRRQYSLRGKITSTENRKIYIEAELFYAEKIYARSKGLFICLTPEQLQGLGEKLNQRIP